FSSLLVCQLKFGSPADVNCSNLGLLKAMIPDWRQGHRQVLGKWHLQVIKVAKISHVSNISTL
ncbi:hypothetical protein, partial [Pseudomonas viridiflava]|uniref:hypothetical protein n=1 Tax=Pseudomonas viridiflava TaxID=33069 RepID=UPI00197FB4E9